MEENENNLISSLPDEILYLILSFLPFESALQTSFLSNRFRTLWNSTLVKHEQALEDVSHAVSSFLIHFNQLNSLKHPRRLQLHFGKKGSTLLASIVANDKLHLDFSSGNNHQDFPRKFSWKLKLNHQNPTCQTLLFVKSLCLKSVNYLNNEVVSSFVSNIKFLENLKIIRCKGLQSLGINSSPKLRRLTIFDCPDLKWLRMIGSFKLRSFQYRGLLPRIINKHHFNLEDAMLDFRHGPGYNGYKSSDFDPTLLTIKNVKVLTLCKWTFEALIWPSISSLEGCFLFYNLKELWWIDNSKEGYDSNALLAFLKMCPSLERLFVTIDPKSYCNPSICTYTKKVGRRVELEHLKFVKMEGFPNKKDEMTLEGHLTELVAVSGKPLIIAPSNINYSLHSLADINELCSKTHAHMDLN